MARAMRPLPLLALLCALAACAQRAAAPPPAEPEGSVRAETPKEQPLPAPLRADVARAEQVGEALYWHDRAAWIATDVLFAAHVLPDDRRVQGWLTHDEGAGRMRVDFVGEVDGTLRRLHAVELVPGEKGQHTSPTPPPPLDAADVAAFRARQRALAADFRACTRTYNPVVLPGALEGQDGWLVYLLAASPRREERVLGGHHRLLVTPDGARVEEQVELSRGCLTVEAPPTPEGTEEAALTVTHALSPAPNETHVFTSLRYEVPLYVLTQAGMWKVDGKRIAYLGHP